MVLSVMQSDIAAYNLPSHPIQSDLYALEQAIRNCYGRRSVLTEAQMHTINQAALEAFWTCDIILNKFDLPDQTFIRFFKHRQHENAIKRQFTAFSVTLYQSNAWYKPLRTRARLPFPLPQ